MMGERQLPSNGEQQRCTRGCNAALVLGTLAVLTPLYCFTERITYGNGFGWDGKAYALWARNFVEEVLHKKPDQYYIQRIFPSALISAGLHLLHIAPTDAHLIGAFVLLNLTMLGLCAWGWCLIADELRISLRGKLVGAVGLFVNAAVMKCSAYYPVLTDLTAYALGVWMLLCYLRGWSIGLYLLTLVGAFTWPSILYCGAALLLFGRTRLSPERPAPDWIRMLIAGGSAFVIVAASIFLRGFGYPGFLGHPGGMPLEQVIYLSVAIAALYWLLGSYILVDGEAFRGWRPWLRSVHPLGIGLALSLIALRWLQVHELSSQEGRLDLNWRLQWTVFTSMMKPGVFFIAHVVYFGPIVLLAAFLWKPLCRLIRSDGVGLTLCALVLFAESVCSESRGMINLFPILVAYTAKLTDSLSWRTSDYVGFGLLSLAFSKVWLVINTEPFGPSSLQFPNQKLQMNHGPWMSNSMYLVQGACVIACAIVFYVSLPMTVRAAPAEKEGRLEAALPADAV